MSLSIVRDDCGRAVFGIFELFDCDFIVCIVYAHRRYSLFGFSFCRLLEVLADRSFLFSIAYSMLSLIFSIQTVDICVCREKLQIKLVISNFTLFVYTAVIHCILIFVLLSAYFYK